MIPAIAWMIGAYVIFRCVERIVAAYIPPPSDGAAVIISIAAGVTIIVVVINLAMISQAANAVAPSLLP